MNKDLAEKLQTLPNEPGVYFHLDSHKKIIYVGKAVNLRSRVKSYFQSSRQRDLKTDLLVEEIAMTDWVTVDSEMDALFLESEMIKRYKPKYNILLRDDKNYLYVRIPVKDQYPAISFVRRPLDDGAKYFGPYVQGYQVRKALKLLRKIFPYSTHQTLPSRVCLQYHLGICPGVEAGKITSKDYKQRLKKIQMYLEGKRPLLEKQLKNEMTQAATAKDFERAAQLRNQLTALKALKTRVIFSDRELFDTSKDQALVGLQELLQLESIPRRIEGYDISHQSGTNTAASMVVFTNGVSDKSEYRKFKMQLPGNDDFAHMREVISRRFHERNKKWPRPELILIDGGKGQLHAALQALDELGIHLPSIGLAKRYETIIVPSKVAGGSYQFEELQLDKNNHISMLLQRVRDESHRFAVSYHSSLKRSTQTASVLEQIPGIGPATRKKLIKAFGGMRAVGSASKAEVATVVGPAKAEILWSYVAAHTPESVRARVEKVQIPGLSPKELLQLEKLYGDDLGQLKHARKAELERHFGEQKAELLRTYVRLQKRIDANKT